jgi:hypothetical protein
MNAERSDYLEQRFSVFHVNFARMKKRGEKEVPWINCLTDGINKSDEGRWLRVLGSQA